VVGRQPLAELGFEPAASPDSFHENRLESEGSPRWTGLYCGLPAAAGELIADCGFQIGKFVGRFCETPFI